MRTFKEMDVVVIDSESLYGELLDFARAKGVPVTKGKTRHDYRIWPHLLFNLNEITGSSTFKGNVNYNWISVDEFKEYCCNWNPVYEIF